MTMTAMMTIGEERIAFDVATYHHDGGDDRNGWDYLTRGEHRSIYVDYDTDTVYKVGRDEANRREHEVLTDARLSGCDFAPATSLYEVTVTNQWGSEVTCTVVAMPYLPEDGSVEHEGVIYALAADFNPDNVVSNGGQLWLIDAGGML